MTLPLALGLLTRSDAIELAALLEGTVEGSLRLDALPEHLKVAARRLALWQMTTSPTRH